MSEVVWSVNILLGIGLLGVAYVIYYILKEAADELNVSIQDQENHQSH
jgi:hypothetical protein